MLINCPRCGFSQPKDQYCAQCGVDMQSFRPKEKPFFKALVENAAVQVIVLLFIAGFVGHKILNGSATQLLGQRAPHSQGFTRSQKKANSTDAAENSSSAFDSESGSGPTADENESARRQKISDNTPSRKLKEAMTGAGATAASGTAEVFAGADAGTVTFNLTYAEIANEVVNKWIYDSSNLGLYQSLPEYSVGILYDFKKRGDVFKQSLKTASLKVRFGSSASNLAGVMSDDGSQLIGFNSGVELKSGENEALHGSITVTKNSRQGSEVFPSEFELPKGAAFFILGALKTENFLSERSKLQMPPFQIFKSPDFMTHKTEFVIILEPDYK